MTDKDNEDFEMLDLKEFGIEDEEVVDVRKMSERNNLSVLSRRLKNIDSSIIKMDDSLIEIIWNLDNIIEDSENSGSMFQNDCQEAIEKILELVEASHDMLSAFEKMKEIKDKISSKK